MKAVVLIPAAGMGRRMGGAVSKQYLELAGRPILAHTLARFDSHPQVESIYPIVPSEDFNYCQKHIVERFGFSKIRRLIAGGQERQHSVANGLAALREDGYTEEQRPVLIHDGARPLFDASLVDGLLARVSAEGACIVAVPVKDTIKEVDNARISGCPERSRLWQAQTPQGFLFPLIARALARALEDRFQATDDASLVERLGVNVGVMEGCYRNIKVTTPEDLVIATALLDSEREKSA